MAASEKCNRFISQRSAAALVASLMTVGCAPLPPPKAVEISSGGMLPPPTGIEILPDEMFPRPMADIGLEPDATLPQPTSIEMGSDETLLINQILWSDFLDYIKLLESVKPGAYVVSQTGLARGYALCAEVHQCYNTDYYVRHALRMCEAEGDTCVVFARDSAIVVSFEIID